MQPDRFTTARNWRLAANGDLRAAGALATDEPNLACFHAQQAAEKYVKALLVGVAGDIARTHSADGLLDELTALGVAVDDDVRRGLLLLEKYYMSTRYPIRSAAPIRLGPSTSTKLVEQSDGLSVSQPIARASSRSNEIET